MKKRLGSPRRNWPQRHGDREETKFICFFSVSLWPTRVTARSARAHQGTKFLFCLVSERGKDRIPMVQETGERGDMETALARISLSLLTDDQLLDYLRTQEDRLPRDVVDEFVRRAERMIVPLTEISRDERSWKQADALYWAPVHA